MNEKKKWILFASICVLGLLVLTTVNGCDLQKMVKFDVPPAVREVTGSEKQETLANSAFVWSEWESHVKTNSDRLASSIDDANSRIAVIQNLTNLGLGVLGDNMGGIPGGAMIMSTITLLGGLFMKRPGEDKRVNKEKEDSYNAGMAVAKDIIEEVTPN